MAFDDGDKILVKEDNQPDFASNLARYTEQVEAISVDIKAAQQSLADINVQIEAAKVQRQGAYDLQIKDLDQQIADKTLKLQGMQTQHVDWVAKLKARQAEHDNISLNFSEDQKRLDDSWTAFRLNNSSLSDQQNQLKKDQAALLDQQNQLVINRQKFEDAKAVQQSAIDDMISDASEKQHDASNQLAAAILKASLVESATKDLGSKEADLAVKLAAAQPFLDLADAIAKQKAQNEIDAKNNSATALQNQEDYNQVRTAKIALNNNEQDYNSRMATLRQAEAALNGGK